MGFTISRRQVLGAGLSVAAISALAACGSGRPGEPAGSTPLTQPAGSEGVTPAGETATIQFWHRTFTPTENEWYKQIVKDFNAAQTAVRVVDTEVPADAWDQKMKAAQAAGKAPDVYTHSGAIQDAVAAGQLHELNEIVGEAPLKEIIDAAQSVAQIGGKYYAYPLLLEPQCVLFWNKDLLQAAGLDPETPPKTWDELVSMCEKIRPTLSAGQYCISPAMDAETLAWSSVGQQFNFAGHTALTDDWAKPNIDNAEYRALIDAYKKLWDNGYMPKQALAAYVVGKDFGEKKVAFKVSGSWMMSEIGSDFNDLLPRTGVAKFVTAPGGQSRTSTTLGNFKWVVDAKTKQAKAAGEFLKWCIAGDPKKLVPFFVKTQFTKVPVRKSVQAAVAADPGAANAPWSSIIVNEIAAEAIPEPQYPWDISLAVGTAMEAGMKGASTTDVAIRTAIDAITKVIVKDRLPEQAAKTEG